MAQLPADVSPGDPNHTAHHDALHNLINYLDTLGGGNATAFVIDEDSMASNSATRPPSQQSTKAYVDARSLNDLANVTAPTPSDGQALAWNASLADWRPTTYAVPAVLDEDDMATNSATAVPTQQSTKAYVDAEVSGAISNTGTTRNTHAHSVSGALSVTRAGADQYTTVTVTDDITGFTDNMSNGDLLRLVLKNGTAADYTADLSSIPTLADPAVDLSATINLYETTVIVVLLEKVEGIVYAAQFETLVAGAAQIGAAAIRGFYMAGGVSVPTVAASALSVAPQSGDGILFVVTAPGPSAQATVNYTAPAGATQLADFAGSGFAPRMRVYYKTYASEANWTFGADSGICRVSVIALSALTTFAAGTPVATLDPGAVTNPAAGIGLYIAAAGWDSGDDSTWTNHPAGHTLVVDNRATVAAEPNMQTQIAALALEASGSYDPGPATFGPSTQVYASVAVAATA